MDLEKRKFYQYLCTRTRYRLRIPRNVDYPTPISIAIFVGWSRASSSEHRSDLNQIKHFLLILVGSSSTSCGGFFSTISSSESDSESASDQFCISLCFWLFKNLPLTETKLTPYNDDTVVYKSPGYNIFYIENSWFDGKKWGARYLLQVCICLCREHFSPPSIHANDWHPRSGIWDLG